MTTIKEYNFFLDSKYRSNGENASPIFLLDEPIRLENDNNYFEAQILSVDIPFSFKTLYSPQNILPITFICVQDSINTSGNLTIPEGNYSITNLLDVLVTKITDFVSIGNFVNHLPTFDFVYSRETGKATLNIIAGSGSHDVSITLIWSQADILAEYFGFNYTANTILSYNAADVITSINFVSPYNVNVSPITSLYIRSTSLNQVASNQEQLVEQKFTTSDILLKVPVNTFYNSWITYENPNFSVKLNNKSILDIQFFMTSLTYDAIIFQGVHWRIHLQIREIETDLTRQIKRETANLIAQMGDLNTEKERLIKELENIKKELTEN